MIGTSLGHYKILEELGKGGMGEVFVAEDTKLHRRVALKILPAKFARSASRRERFEREARAVAALDHPNIVTIFSVEETEGIHFITMQLLDGELLSERVPPNGLQLEEFMDLAVALASALAAAHAKGVVHRDIKPANILITEDGTAKILDFGLAKLEQTEPSAEDAELDTLELTKPGSVMGTASYMSPEQLQGDPIDARSDIFSLGVVLYQMACGRRPFRGRTPIAVASSILRDSPAPITEVRKELPRELARIVAACLEVSADDRIQSTADLGRQLEELKRNLDSGVSVFFTGLQRVATSPKRRRMALVSALLVALLLVAVVWTALTLGKARLGTSREGPIRIAALPLENLGPPDEEYFAAGITDEITTRLAGVSGLQVTSSTSALQFQSDRYSTREIGEVLDVHYLLIGTVRWAGLGSPDSQVRITPKLVRVSDDSQIWAEAYTFAIDDIFQVQTQIAESVVARLGTRLLAPERQTLRARKTDNIDAYKAHLEGQHIVRQLDYTLETWERAVEAFERAVALDPQFAVAWSELATAQASIYFQWLDPSNKRKMAAARAIARARELDPNGSSTLLALANYHYMIERDYDLALHALNQAQADRAVETEALKTRGYVLRRQGSWAEAIQALERAFELDPRDATAAAEVAETYEVVRDIENALVNYERSIAIDPAQTYSYHSAARTNWTLAASLEGARRMLERMPDSDGVASNLAWFWQEIYEKNFDAALERLASSSIETYEYWDGFYPRSLLEAQAFELSGSLGAARKAYAEARTLLENETTASNRDPRRPSALGLAYAGLGMAEEAIQAGRRAVELYPIAEDAYSGPTPALELALILARIGRSDDAIDLLEELLAQPAVITRNLLELDPRWAPIRDHPRFAELEDSYR